MNFYNSVVLKAFDIMVAILFSFGLLYGVLEPMLTLIDDVVAWNWLVGEAFVIMMALILVGLVYSSLLYISTPILALPLIFAGALFAWIFTLISVAFFLPKDLVTVLSFLVAIPFMILVIITLYTLVVLYYQLHQHR